MCAADHNGTEGLAEFSSTTGLKRVVTASMAGTVVEWYEFFLYGTAIPVSRWAIR